MNTNIGYIFYIDFYIKSFILILVYKGFMELIYAIFKQSFIYIFNLLNHNFLKVNILNYSILHNFISFEEKYEKKYYTNQYIYNDISISIFS